MRELTAEEMTQVGGGDCTGFVWYLIFGTICCTTNGVHGCYQF